MAALGNGGPSIAAVPSSARTRPTASSNATRSVRSIGWTASMMMRMPSSRPRKAFIGFIAIALSSCPHTTKRAQQAAPLQGTSHVILSQVLQVSLGIHGSHAARARSGNRLTVNMVLDIARREDPGHTRLRAAISDDISALVHLQLPREQSGIGGVADRYEDAVARQRLRLRRTIHACANRRHLPLLRVQDFLDRPVP